LGVSPSVTPSTTPSETPSETPSVTPTNSLTPTPTTTPSISITPSVSLTPTLTPTPSSSPFSPCVNDTVTPKGVKITFNSGSIYTNCSVYTGLTSTTLTGSTYCTSM